jgi:hypothetical protein
MCAYIAHPDGEAQPSRRAKTTFTTADTQAHHRLANRVSARRSRATQARKATARLADFVCHRPRNTASQTSVTLPWDVSFRKLGKRHDSRYCAQTLNRRLFRKLVAAHGRCARLQHIQMARPDRPDQTTATTGRNRLTSTKTHHIARLMTDWRIGYYSTIAVADSVADSE